MSVISAHPQLHEPFSTVSPIGWSVLDVERDQWHSFAVEVVNDTGFWQLVVILAHNISPRKIRWTGSILQNVVSPHHPQRNERFKALVIIRQIAQLPLSATVSNLRFSGELLQAFMRPVLPAKDRLLQPTWLQAKQSLGSAPITHISLTLEKLGIPMDQTELLARRRQLLNSLSDHQIQPGLLSQPLSLPSLRKFARSREQLVAELGKPINTDFMETIVDVVALTCCKDCIPFLNEWCQLLEAEHMISQVHETLNRQSSQDNKLMSPNEILLLLVAAYMIQRLFFGPGTKTDQEPYLPSCLCRQGPELYKNAVLSYAWYSHTELTLSVLVPSLCSRPEDTREMKAWNDYWGQRFPPNWDTCTSSGMTFIPDGSNQQPCNVGDRSYFSDDESYTVERSMLGFFTQCFWK